MTGELVAREAVFSLKWMLCRAPETRFGLRKTCCQTIIEKDATPKTRQRNVKGW